MTVLLENEKIVRKHEECFPKFEIGRQSPVIEGYFYILCYTIHIVHYGER